MLLSPQDESRDRTGSGLNSSEAGKLDNEMDTSDEEDEKVDVGSVADLRPNLSFNGDQEVSNESHSKDPLNGESSRKDVRSLGVDRYHRTPPSRGSSPTIINEVGPAMSSSFPPSHMIPYLYSSGLYLPPPHPGVFLPGTTNTNPFLHNGHFIQTPSTSSFHPNLLFNAHLAMLNQSYQNPASDLGLKYHPQRFWPYPLVSSSTSASIPGSSQPIAPELRSPLSSTGGSPYEANHFKPSSSPGSDGGASSVGSSSSDLKSMENMVNGLERQQGMPVTLSTLRDK